MRFEDTAGLFGASGVSTEGNIECEFCGNEYLDREDGAGEVFQDMEPICFCDFAGLQICQCCFERIEKAVFQRLPVILPWAARIVKARDERHKILLGHIHELVFRLLEAKYQGAGDG